MELRDKVRGLALDRKVAKITLVGVPDRPGIARAVFDPLAEAGINVDLIVQNVGHAGATDLSFTVPTTDLARARRLLDPVVRELGFARHDHRCRRWPRSPSSAPGIRTRRATPRACSARSPTRASTSR